METRTGDRSSDIEALIPSTEVYCSSCSDFRDLQKLRPHVIWLRLQRCLAQAKLLEATEQTDSARQGGNGAWAWRSFSDLCELHSSWLR